MTATAVASILLVEDDDQDAFLFAEALREVAPEACFDHVKDAQTALQRAASADCIVLDLNLGAQDGLWLLDQLLGDDRLRTLPVIVFSGDVGRMSRASSAFSNVAASVRKPNTMDDYASALHIVLAVLQAAVRSRSG
ncbi:MAG: response regulator [Pseudomonadota bacterium]